MAAPRWPDITPVNACDLKSYVNQNRDHALRLLESIAYASGPMVQTPRGPLLIFFTNVIGMCNITPSQAGDDKIQATMATVNEKLSQFHKLVQDAEVTSTNGGKFNEKLDAYTQSSGDQIEKVTQTEVISQENSTSKDALQPAQDSPQPAQDALQPTQRLQRCPCCGDEIEEEDQSSNQSESSYQEKTNDPQCITNPLVPNASDQPITHNSHVTANKDVGVPKEGTRREHGATQMMIDPQVRGRQMNDGAQKQNNSDMIGGNRMEAKNQDGNPHQGQATGAPLDITHTETQHDKRIASREGTIQQVKDVQNPVADVGKAPKHDSKRAPVSDYSDSSDSDDSSTGYGSSGEEDEEIVEEEDEQVGGEEEDETMADEQEEGSSVEEEDEEEEDEEGDGEETTPDTSMSEHADSGPKPVHEVKPAQKPRPFPLDQCEPQPTTIPCKGRNLQIRVRIINKEIAKEVRELSHWKLKECLKREIYSSKAHIETAKVMPTGEIRITATDVPGANALRDVNGWRRGAFGGLRIERRRTAILVGKYSPSFNVLSGNAGSLSNTDA
ncbi:MAG: hypothetical protein Q9220_006242 [cf. Caloplaca sp. 1 TL-2023]